MVFGIFVFVLGVLGILCRRALANLAMKIFTNGGLEVDPRRLSSIERGYALGGLFMALAGVGTTIFALLTGR